MCRLVRIIGLMLAVWLVVPAAFAGADEAEDVRNRADELYSRLIGKNVRHYRVRDDLQPFFSDPEALSNWLIRLARDFESASIRDYQPEEHEVEVVDVDATYGVAEVKVRLKGDWFLWFNRSFERTDQWKLIDERWIVDVPPLRNLDFK